MAHQHGHSQSDAHRDPQAPEAPLDAANQSLADAFRASFKVLKLIMLVLVILFLLTGVQFIEPSEQAVVARFGQLLPGTRAPGASLAYPYPIDETLRVPVRQDNVVTIDDHFLALTEQEKGQSLSQLGRPTLNPVKDGALLTSDHGLVHVQWRLVYQIENLPDFVKTVADGGTKGAELLIKAILDSAAIRVAATEYTADEITRSKGSEMAARVRARVNQQLETLGTGIRVVSLEIPRSSVPIPTLAAFQAVSSAENQKQKRIREAEQERDEMLNTCAGETYRLILAALDAWEAAQAAGDEEASTRHQAELDRLIQFESGGEARAEISRAESYFTEVVEGIQADVNECESMMAEYRRAPDLLFARLWTETKRRIFDQEGVEKWVLPQGQKEVRIEIGPDPQQRLLDEMKQIGRKAKGSGGTGPP
ncbi:MAG: SPFH domain-containing protein [Planctomycetota bacterium]